MAQQSWQELLGNAEEGPEPLPDGPYDLVVDTARFKPAKTGAPMIEAVFKVVTGPYAGKKTYNNFVLTMDNPTALGYFFKHMEALGLSQAWIATLPPPEQGGMDHIANALVGRHCTAVLGHRTWQGKQKNEMGDIIPYRGGAVPSPEQPQYVPAPGAPDSPAMTPQSMQPMAPPQPTQLPAPLPPPAPVAPPAPVPEPPAPQPAPAPVAPPPMPPSAPPVVPSEAVVPPPASPVAPPPAPPAAPPAPPSPAGQEPVLPPPPAPPGAPETGLDEAPF